MTEDQLKAVGAFIEQRVKAHTDHLQQRIADLETIARRQKTLPGELTLEQRVEMLEAANGQ